MKKSNAMITITFLVLLSGLALSFEGSGVWTRPPTANITQIVVNLTMNSSGMFENLTVWNSAELNSTRIGNPLQNVILGDFLDLGIFGKYSLIRFNSDGALGNLGAVTPLMAIVSSVSGQGNPYITWLDTDDLSNRRITYDDANDRLDTDAMLYSQIGLMTQSTNPIRFGEDVTDGVWQTKGDISYTIERFDGVTDLSYKPWFVCDPSFSSCGVPTNYYFCLDQLGGCNNKMVFKNDTLTLKGNNVAINTSGSFKIKDNTTDRVSMNNTINIIRGNTIITNLSGNGSGLTGLVSPMGETFLDDNNVKTIISSAGTWIPVNGTWKVNPENMMFSQWANGTLKYVGSKTKFFHIAATLSVKSVGANDVMKASVFKNGIRLNGSQVQEKLQGINDVGSTAIHVAALLSQNDHIQLRIMNQNNTNSLTVGYANMFAMGMSTE